MSTVRLILADDNAALRKDIAQELAVYEDIEVVGEAPDGLAALEVCAAQEADVLLLDVIMPRMDGLSVLAELQKRSLLVPGGTCGFWGTCGAATSAGQWWSIVSGSTPMTRDPWAQTQRLTSRILGKLADLGGPRCCKRTGFTAILEGVAFAKEMHGVEMETPEKVTCAFYARNAECLKEGCPYFPSKE